MLHLIKLLYLLSERLNFKDSKFKDSESLI